MCQLSQPPHNTDKCSQSSQAHSMALQQCGTLPFPQPLQDPILKRITRLCHHRLVANLGHKATSRKVTRKAIEGVNVPQACDTIEKPPGAPIALRLQSSLLYGVSGVYHKHGVYLLDDTEKMWSRMRTYFREGGAANLTDPNAGKTK